MWSALTLRPRPDDLPVLAGLALAWLVAQVSVVLSLPVTALTVGWLVGRERGLPASLAVLPLVWIAWDDAPGLAPFVGCVVCGVVSITSSRLRRPALLLCLAPASLVPAVGFAQGALDYTRGRATIVHYGKRDRPLDLDRELRCWPSNGGCVELTSAAFDRPRVERAAYEDALQRLTRELGYMPGAYDGPYPSEGEANDLIQNDPRSWTSHEWRGERLVVEGVPLRLPEYGPDLEGRGARTRVTVVEGRCAVVAHHDRLWLIDLRTTRVFAHYDRYEAS